MELRYRLLIIICLVFIVFAIGVVGYSLIEGWSLLDSIYMSVITLSSVGFQEVQPLSISGRIFTAMLIILGMGTVLYGVSTVTAAVVEGRLKEMLRRRKMERQISTLEDHIIVCGIGETGRCIIEELKNTKKNFVLVNDEVSPWLELKEYKNVLYIEGDATEETILKKAGIDKAKALISALSNDTDNIFVVLTARELNPNLRIVSRVSERESEQKFLRAGANAVVCPNQIGGLRLASEIIRPTVVNFLDIMMRKKEMTLRVEEVSVGPGSKLIDKTISEAEIGKKTGVIVLAIKEANTGNYMYSPSAGTVIKEGDVLVVLGEFSHVKKLRSFV